MEKMEKFRKEFLSLPGKLEDELSRIFPTGFTKKFFSDLLSHVQGALNNLFDSILIKNVDNADLRKKTGFYITLNLSIEESDLIKSLLEQAISDILPEPSSKVVFKKKNRTLSFFNEYDLMINDYNKIKFKIKMAIDEDNFNKLMRITKEHGKDLRIYLPEKEKEVPFYWFFHDVEIYIINTVDSDNSDIKNVKYYLEKEYPFNGKFDFIKGEKVTDTEELYFYDYDLNGDGSFRVSIYEINYKSNKSDFNVEYGHNITFSEIISNEIGDFEVSLEIPYGSDLENLRILLIVKNIKNENVFHLEMGTVRFPRMLLICFRHNTFYIRADNPESRKESKKRFVIMVDNFTDFKILNVYEGIIEILIESHFPSYMDRAIREIDEEKERIDGLPVINANDPLTMTEKLRLEVTREELAGLITDYLLS